MKEESPVPSPVILGIDDLRPLPWTTRIARSSGEGVKLLQEHRDSLIDELWLDHDLGGDDSILPVVTLLEEAAFSGRPFRIGTVYVHSANPHWRRDRRPVAHTLELPGPAGDGLGIRFEVWPHPYQVDHKGPRTPINRLPALSDRPLRSGADRHCSRLLVSAAGVSQSTPSRGTAKPPRGRQRPRRL
ncbi:cyclic-phosphate processing receiver domain-containing protein [Streptomyces sp. NPDC007157]|uniref:cyclic-phosphate processing receiver domain-containing protein n=1 Tax=Streptomyces sp. NPDC007157 TaxID=3154681 RepID=UPI00340FC32D